jgi:LmbE family N-acetylglucosaminyl deacetylase
VGRALARTTHLAIGAHPDDLEFGALHGILACFGRADRWFTGVTCTDGAGSARTGVYADYSDEDMKRVRRTEQRTAAGIGRYAAVLQLGYASREVKDPRDGRLQEDLVAILTAARPQVVYTHNPADKHATHVAVTAAALGALRRLPDDALPQTVYGFESWRGLDWLPDARKVVLDVGGRDNLAAALMGVYDSQIAGGKRYDSATLGRYKANATLLESHACDKADLASYAVDLTPLVRDRSLDPVDYVTALIDEFRSAVREELRRVL